METTLMVHSRWPREMCRERTFYGEARRWIYTYLLEGHEQKGKLARLCRSMYGTRDAASIWRDTWSEVLKDGSMKVGTACTAFFCSCDGDLKGLCHHTRHIGFSASDAKELKILN